ncbi:hypothetical protein ACIP2Z_02260 [Streptomyces iakyrus]|uniref:Uncharacterized protein n=1 Tax=Streptomyces iakyrus TaxID=68219 RepID=A0ABW8F6W9_9ACTN
MRAPGEVTPPGARYGHARAPPLTGPRTHARTSDFTACLLASSRSRNPDKDIR